MTTLLHLDASARAGLSGTDPFGSHPRRLSRRFVDQWLQHEPDARIIYRDVGQNPPPPVTGRWIHAAFTPETQREPWMREVLRTSDELVDELLAAAHQAQAVLTLRSVWPDDQLYPLARRANIHIVEIDAANPIEGELPGIALTESTLREAKGSATVLINQPWQDSANLARMAMIMADSLSRLAPPQRERLQANFAAISQRLQQAQSEASRQLAQADELPVLLLTPRVQALATALQLEPVPWQAPEKDEDLPAALQKAIQAHRPRAILSHTAPDEAAAQAIAAAGVPLIVLRDNAPDPVQALTDAMLAVAQAMARK